MPLRERRAIFQSYASSISARILECVYWIKKSATRALLAKVLHYVIPSHLSRRIRFLAPAPSTLWFFAQDGKVSFGWLLLNP